MSGFPRLLTRVIDWFYIPSLRRVMPLQTFRYAACGGLNMAMDTLLYYVVFNYVFGQDDVDLGVFVLSAKMAALAVVFPITFFNGFWLNRNVAFKRSPLRGHVQIVRYLVSVGGSIVLTVLFLKFFTEVCHIWATPSKVITTVLTAVYSYLMQKYYTFRGCAEI